MAEEIRIFGAALDALSSLERVNLKLAYINHLRNKSLIEEGFKDPYDFIKTHITRSLALSNKIKWSGKISIPSWLAPKPNIRDSSKLSEANLGKFLENDGCWEYALMIADYINRRIYPGMPVMIGVDHSLTGGSIMALAERYPNLNVVILDAHFDVMNTGRVCEQDHQSRNAVFSSLNDRKIGSETCLNYYGCGNFLDYLLKKEVIVPKNLWILGVQDEIYRELNGRNNLGEKLDLNAISVKKWMETRVHVIFKHEVQSGNFKIDLNGPTYLSIDMDVGSMSSIYSARFMNSYGLNTAEFLQLLHKVSRFIRSSNCPLVGLDVMEFDVYFFEVINEKKIDDRTEEIVKEIFKLFVNQNGHKYVS
jgi:arginase family enzyme